MIQNSLFDPKSNYFSYKELFQDSRLNKKVFSLLMNEFPKIVNLFIKIIMNEILNHHQSSLPLIPCILRQINDHLNTFSEESESNDIPSMA